MNPQVWGIAISAVVAVGSVLGIILSRIGKKGDQEQQFVKEQFDRMLSEVNYWRGTTEATRLEFEGRWSRQLSRCRTVTTGAAVTISHLLAGITGPERADAERVLHEIKSHENTSHDGT